MASWVVVEVDHGRWAMGGGGIRLMEVRCAVTLSMPRAVTHGGAAGAGEESVLKMLVRLPTWRMKASWGMRHRPM